MQLKQAVWTMAMTAILIYRAATSVFAAETPAEKRDTKDDATRLPGVEVRSPRESLGERVFPPDTEKTQIFSGKKATEIDLRIPPPIQNNNYRQTLAQTPGLLLSEESSPLLSLGYRGMEPHRAQFIQVLKDGIPIHADMFGYPEAYYTPPLDTVARIQFIRGGAALMYGPQPGGAFNYVTHMPRRDRALRFYSANAAGSHDYFSTFSALDGGQGDWGYYGYFHYRRSDGFRAANSDFEVFSGNAKIVWDNTDTSRFILSLDGYAEEHGEPGGLTFGTAAGDVNYNADRNATSRFFDRFELERFAASLAWEKEFSERTFLEVKAWGGSYRRFSKRQRGGGFGSLPTGAAATTNTIEEQKFFTAAAEARLRHDWQAGDNEHTFASGILFYNNHSPRVDKRGATPDADDGAVRNDSVRDTHYVSIFAENRFVFGKLSVTPGVRLENVWQKVVEHVNADKTAAGTPLGNADEFDFVPLFGIGAAYQLRKSVEIYANVSQSYRPKMFTQAVPRGGTAVVPADLESGMAWQYELGTRGAPVPYFWWDTSIFYLDFDNQIGSVALGGGLSSTQNVGRTVHVGWEAATELDIVGWLDARRGTKHTETFGNLAVYANTMVLNARFESGPMRGLRPQYAPRYLTRAGVNYRYRQNVKISFSATFVGDHFADDAQTPNRYIPAYGVCDLTAEVTFAQGRASVFGGINNVFDEDYYARIRADGIDPAARRNFYAGFKVRF